MTNSRSIYELYDFDFNSSSPSPPVMSSSVRAVASLVLAVAVVGMFLSLSVLYAILQARLYEKYKSIATLLGWKVALFVFDIFYLSATLHYGRVPSMAMCQFEGFMVHSICLCDIACHVCLAFDRYYKMQTLSLPPSASKARRSANWHWHYTKLVVWPLLIVLSALPILTSNAFGAYGIKADGVLCTAVGGSGILAHDLFPAINVIFTFGVALPAIVFFLFSSQRLISKTLMGQDRANGGEQAGSNGGRSDQQLAGSKKAAMIERRSLLYTFVLILNFLTAWCGWGGE